MNRPQNWIAGLLVVVGILCFVVVSLGLYRSPGMMPMSGMLVGMWIIPAMFLFVLAVAIGIGVTRMLGSRRDDASRRCSECHEHVEHHWGYCPYCGSPITK